MAEEEIVMTPSKRGSVTCISIAKVRKELIDESQVAHKAGGQHKGLVVKKQASDVENSSPPQLQLEFKCFLVDRKTGKHVPESRILKFWFSAETNYFDKVSSAYDFFKELIKPEQFPRDYVGFIKKVMKQMQLQQYASTKRIDVELRPLEELEGQAPNTGTGQMETIERKTEKSKEIVVQEQLLLTLESAYPNILPTDDLAQMLNTDQRTIQEQLRVLMGRNLIKEMEPGKWVRKVLDEKTEVKIVQQMPIQSHGNKPSVAIITSKYYEKLAVDAMMENKTTFVRYKTEGESNVYTIGNIGPHKVVSTKLPQIGRQMAAQISSGNTTTRLLGKQISVSEIIQEMIARIFSDVEHVFLVGVCGGVPHYTDYYNHVRLGDIILSMPNNKGQIFIYCDKKGEDKERNQIQFALKSWAPQDPLLRSIAEKIYDRAHTDPSFHPWEDYIYQGQQLLKGQEVAFERPRPDTDRLFMNIGGDDVIEVGHPPVPEEARFAERAGAPKIRLGAIASGKPLIQEDQLRMEFTGRHQCVGVDTEFDQVLEAIIGSRKESFICIRGVCDYYDGTKNVVWQPYSALAAAAFMRAIIERIPVQRAD